MKTSLILFSFIICHLQNKCANSHLSVSYLKIMLFVYFKSKKMAARTHILLFPSFYMRNLSLWIITSILLLIRENIKSNHISNKPYFAIHRKTRIIYKTPVLSRQTRNTSPHGNRARDERSRSRSSHSRAVRYAALLGSQNIPIRCKNNLYQAKYQQ